MDNYAGFYALGSNQTIPWSLHLGPPSLDLGVDPYLHRIISLTYRV